MPCIDLFSYFYLNKSVLFIILFLTAVHGVPDQYLLTSPQCDGSFLYYLFRNALRFVSHLFHMNWHRND